MIELEKALKQMNIEYNPETLQKFQSYMDEIIEWNEKVNLTSITERREFVQKHFIDSILCANRQELCNAKSVIDVGTGAGFPGVPLALIMPNTEFLLMDSLNKRIKILQEICTKLEIKNVKLFHARAEEAARQKELRESFDVCVSRAVANLATLSEYCLPFVKVGGCFVAYKGPDCQTEATEAERAIKLLGGRIDDIWEPVLSDFPLEHKMICIKKVGKTPAKYPRKAGTPSKEPLK